MYRELRVLLDTNIYGLIVRDFHVPTIVQKLENGNIVVCGCSVIRKELRSIPKKNVVGRAGFRRLALEVYDGLVENKRNYAITDFTKALTLAYRKKYSGRHSLKELEKDFLIVATASMHDVGIVVSNDEKTMMSPESALTYKIVNEEFEVNTPKFMKLDEFMQLIKWFP